MAEERERKQREKAEQVAQVTGYEVEVCARALAESAFDVGEAVNALLDQPYMPVKPRKRDKTPHSSAAPAPSSADAPPPRARASRSRSGR